MGHGAAICRAVSGQRLIQHLQRQHGPLHQIFELAIAAKGLFAAAEALTGIGLLLTPPASVQHWIDWFLTTEIVEERHGPIQRLIEALALRYNADAQHFFALYLILHGLAKLVVVTMLQRRVAFAYPLAIAVFAGFVVYQGHEWLLRGSPVMLALTLFDLMVIALTWREWRQGGGAAR